jgi:hypothetical protein
MFDAIAGLNEAIAHPPLQQCVLDNNMFLET